MGTISNSFISKYEIMLVFVIYEIARWEKIKSDLSEKHKMVLEQKLYSLLQD